MCSDQSILIFNIAHFLCFSSRLHSTYTQNVHIETLHRRIPTDKSQQKHTQSFLKTCKFPTKFRSLWGKSNRRGEAEQSARGRHYRKPTPELISDIRRAQFPNICIIYLIVRKFGDNKFNSVPHFVQLGRHVLAGGQMKGGRRPRLSTICP